MTSLFQEWRQDFNAKIGSKIEVITLGSIKHLSRMPTTCLKVHSRDGCQMLAVIFHVTESLELCESYPQYCAKDPVS